MVGRFAYAVRPSSRGLSPRRARTLVVMASVLLLGLLAVVTTLRQSHALPHIALAATKTSLGKSTVHQAHRGAGIAAPTKVAQSAEIVTCPSCRLNSLPKVKAFVHGDSKLFPKLKVTFQYGHDPTLYFYDNAKKKLAEVDLAPMDGTDIIRKLYSYSIFPSSKSKSVTDALGTSPTLQS